MKHFLRLAVSGLGGMALAVYPAAMQGEHIQRVAAWQDGEPLLVHASSQGYLGINIRDVDTDRAQALKLKEIRGAEITTVDHDAPASQAGLKVHDVIISLNGQQVEGTEQLRRMLHETPPGHTVTLALIRDGAPLTVQVQLADRAQVAANAWHQHLVVPEPAGDLGGSSFMGSGASTSGSHGFWSLYSGPSFSSGATVDPLGKQLASFFGVQQGLLVKNVQKGSPADISGLKAGDIVLKLNQETMATRDDWTRTLRASEGKPVQVVVLREKKQQTLQLVIDNKHSRMEPMPFALTSPDDDIAAMLDHLEMIDTKALAEQARLAAEPAMEAALAASAQRLKTETEGQMEEFQGQKELSDSILRSIDIKGLQQQVEKTLEETRRNLEEMRSKPKD